MADLVEMGQKVPDERWHAYVVLLEADKQPLSSQAKETLIKAAGGIGGEMTPREKGLFRVITKSSLEAKAKKYGQSSKTDALAAIMKADRIEGLTKKGFAPEPEREVIEDGNDEDGNAVDAGADASAQGGADGGSAGAPSSQTPKYESDAVLAEKWILRNDERENSADVIYLLVDFPSNAQEALSLAEHKETSFGGIVTLVTSQGGETKSSRPPSREDQPTPGSARDSSAAAQGSSSLGSSIRSAKNPLLMNCCFDEIGVDNEKGVLLKKDDLYTKFSQVVADAAIDKSMFDQYDEALIEVTIPFMSKEEQQQVTEAMAQAAEAVEKCKTLSRCSAWKGPACAAYNAYLGKLSEQSISSGVLVLALVDAIAVAGGEKESTYSQDASAIDGPWLLPAQDNAQVAAAASATMLITSHGGLGSGNFEEFNAIRRRALQEQQLWSVGVQVPGGRGRRLLPTKPVYSIRERGIRKTELTAYTTMDEAEVTRTRKMEGFGELMRERDPSFPWDFHSWRYWEELDGSSLTSTVSAFIGDGAEVYTKYFAEDDTMLIALHTPTAKGRQGTDEWKPLSEVRVGRPVFPAWRAEQVTAAHGKPAIPDQLTMAAMTTTLQPEAVTKDLKEGNVSTVRMYPSDHSIIRMTKTKLAGRWLSVDKDGQRFGLREPVPHPDDGDGKKKKGGKKKKDDGIAPFDASFVASFTDGSRVTVTEGTRMPKKPDGKGTVLVSTTLPTGLIVKNGSDGGVVQQYATRAQSVPEAARPEVWRKVSSTGVVIRQMFNGDISRLLPDGGVALLTADQNLETGGMGRWIYTRPDGTRVSTINTPGLDNIEQEEEAEKKRETAKLAAKFAKKDGGGKDKKGKDKKGKKDGGGGMAAMMMMGGKGPNPNADEVLEPFPVVTEVDPETHATVKTIPGSAAEEEPKTKKKKKKKSKASAGQGAAQKHDEAMVVVYVDGTRLTRHADGTQMVLRPDGHAISVKCDGYASVNIDLEVNGTAQLHSHGVQVAIKMGGERVRSVTCLPDGTVVECAYNTKVTTLVNGKVYVRKPTGETVTALDGSEVEYRCVEVADAMPQHLPDEVDEEPDLRSEVFVFNLIKGELKLEDGEHNDFLINFVDGSTDLDLAGVTEGVSARSVVNHPVEPRLFVMRGDGTGSQLMRPEDVEHYLRVVKRQPHTTKPDPTMMHGFKLVDGAKPMCHTFLQHLAPYAEPSPTQLTNPPPADPTLPMVVLSKSPPTVDNLTPPPVAVVTRHLHEVPPLTEDNRHRLWAELAELDGFRDDRLHQDNRYSVLDTRSKKLVEDEEKMQREIMKAYKKAKKKRMEEKKRAQAKAAQQAAEEAAAEAAAAAAEGGAPGMKRGNTMKRAKEAAAKQAAAREAEAAEEQVEEDGPEYEFTDSDEEQDKDDVVDEPTRVMYEAFDNYKDDEEDKLMSAFDVRQALIEVLGFGPTSNEVEQLILETTPNAYDVSCEHFLGLDLDGFIAAVMLARAQDADGLDDEEQENLRIQTASAQGMAATMRDQHRTGVKQGGTNDGVFWGSVEGKQAGSTMEILPPKGTIYDITGEEVPTTSLRPKNQAGQAATVGGLGGLAQGSAMRAIRSGNNMGNMTSAAALNGQGSIANSGGVNGGSTIQEGLQNSRSAFQESLSMGTAMDRSIRGEMAHAASRGRTADVDVLGNARDKAVRMRPVSKGELNVAYQDRESDSLRAVNTASTGILPHQTEIGCQSTTAELVSDNDLQVTPPVLALGQLQQGCTYRFPFVLANTGHDGCRFRVIAKDMNTADKNFVELLNKPTGLIAAGMRTPMEIEVRAGTAGPIADFVEIHGEKELFTIPVTASVRSAGQYDKTKTAMAVKLLEEGREISMAALQARPLGAGEY